MILKLRIFGSSSHAPNHLWSYVSFFLHSFPVDSVLSCLRIDLMGLDDMVADEEHEPMVSDGFNMTSSIILLQSFRQLKAVNICIPLEFLTHPLAHAIIERRSPDFVVFSGNRFVYRIWVTAQSNPPVCVYQC